MTRKMNHNDYTDAVSVEEGDELAVTIRKPDGEEADAELVASEDQHDNHIRVGLPDGRHFGAIKLSTGVVPKAYEEDEMGKLTQSSETVAKVLNIDEV